MVPGHVQALQDMFCAPTVHPTAPTSPTIGANIFEHFSLLNNFSAYFMASRGCRVHCRDTNVFPVVPGHALVSFVSATSFKVCRKKASNTPKIAHFTKEPLYPV